MDQPETKILIETAEQKPKKKKYGNNLYLTDLSDVSRSIWELGRKYEIHTMKVLMQNKRNAKHPANLTKIFYFTYLTGSRIGEMLREPYPKLSILALKEWQIVHIEKQNEKHWKSRKEGIRELITQNIPVDNEYEKKMWDKITDEGALLNTRAWLPSFGGYSKRNALNGRFKHNFKARLTDGNTVYEARGINPHILRHLRAYNLLINKGYEETLIQKFFGWSKKAMLEHYTYIKLQLKDKEQMQILERMLTMKASTERNAYKIGNMP